MEGAYQGEPIRDSSRPAALRSEFRWAKLCSVTRSRRRASGTEEAASPADRKFVGALGRGLDVLRCFGPRDPWLANQEIAARTSLARPTVSRLTYTLTELGFLRHSKSQRKYALGAAAVSLGYSALAQVDIRGSARPFLHALSQHTNASVHLAINDELHMQVLDTYWHSAVFVVDIGSRVTLATTSLGRAYVCALPEDERKAMLQRVRAKRPAQWSATRRRFEEAFRDYEAHGFCLGLGDWRREVNAVAAPLDPGDGTKPVVIGCSGAAFQLPPELLRHDIGPRLVALIGNLRSAISPRE
jgi:DNA-binding IclR family transcriptional regulator